MNRILMTLLITLLIFNYSPLLHANNGNYIQIDESLKLYFEQEGSGPQAIVFIPGWTMSSKIFKHQLAFFKNSKKFKAYAFDPRGQGQSSKPDTGYTYDQRGRDLAAFIEYIQAKDVILVGWSFGVLDMLSYISQNGSGKLRGLVILDGSPTTMVDNINGAWAWIDRLDSQSTRESTTLAVLSNPRKFYKQFAEWMLDKPTTEAVNEIIEIAMQTPPYVAALTNETASYANYEKNLVDLEGKLPLYYIVRAEWASTVDLWRKKHTPSAQLTSMGKHLMFWEHHSEFNQLLESFLKKL